MTNDSTADISEQPSFSNVAKDVIRNSIRSAICIDDRYASAYEEDITDLYVEEPRKLYKSFREDGLCDLDIYRFTTYEETWNKDVMLSNKDLLILDWELDTGGGFESAIKILSDVINSKKIPFIVVYTSTADLHLVNRAIIKEFSLYNNEIFKLVCTSLLESYSSMSEHADLIEADIFLEANEDKFYEYIFNWGRRSEIEAEILQSIRSEFYIKEQFEQKRIRSKISSALNSVIGEHKDGLLELALLSIAQESITKYTFCTERIHTDQHAFRLNGTIALVYHKQQQADGIKPEDLFEVFADAIVSNPHNFLNILSLEMKDRLRGTFSKIGTQFAKTDEQAFFYHLENYRTQNGNLDYNLRSIYDFILKSWIGELHQQQINELPLILGFANHRYENLLSRPPKELTKANTDLILELVRYCAYVSTSRVAGRSDSSLRFGDLFLNSSNPEEFYLCITPSCDCLHSGKIGNNFYLVKGESFNNFNALKGAETGFRSFILIDNEPKCIEWQVKPFTTYITDNNINQLIINYSGLQIELKHLIILKENYTQRIANQSFGYGHRVGIDLPHA